MPLYDHFHGPLSRRPWESFHGRWAFAIADDLNRRLPKEFIVDAPMHLGASVSADVAEYEQVSENGRHTTQGTLKGNGGGSIALATETYAPPAPSFSMPAAFPPDVKVEIRDQSENYRLLAVIELVSPSNKKEEGERERFAAKCLSYLGTGVGLTVIDIVTSRLWNLHNVLIHLAEQADQFLMADDPPIYVTSYRPVSRNNKDSIDVWPWTLTVGSILPTVPLPLKGYGCIGLDLEATYMDACQNSRIEG